MKLQVPRIRGYYFTNHDFPFTVTDFGLMISDGETLQSL